MYSELPNGRFIRSPIIQKQLNLNYPITGAKSCLSGASGLVSTAEDYAKFLQMILNKGMFKSKQIASEKTIALITTNQTGNLMVGKNNYSFGFNVVISANFATK